MTGDEGEPRTPCGAMGLLAWHRAGSREDRCEGCEMVVRWRSQLGASAARLQWLFLLPSSTAVLAPWSYTLLGGAPTEAATHLRGRLGPSLEVMVIEEAFLWLQTLTEQRLSDIFPLPGLSVMRSCWEGKGGASFCFLCFLCCLNCTWPKPKEMRTDVNMHVKTGRSCSAGHWGAVWMVSPVIPFPRAWRHILQLCHSYSPNQNALLLMVGN